MATAEDDFNLIPDIKDAIEYIASHQIEIGIFGEDDSEMLMIARVNEFGTTIEPKKADSLTIPLIDEAIGRSPTEFNDLFIPEGTHVLARERGDGIQPVYALMKSVTIPERSFMRAGYDSNRSDFEEKGDQLIQRALVLDITPQAAFDALGNYIVTSIQEFLTNLSDPSNSPATTGNKGSSNPLVDEGHLRDAITYKIGSR